MLIAITFNLISERDTILPAHLGRAHYAETLQRLGAASPALAVQIHDGDGPKPLTCSGLIGARVRQDGSQIEAGRSYAVRVTGLTRTVSETLAGIMLDNPPESLTLAHHTFRVERAECDASANPWTGRIAYDELAAHYLVSADNFARMVPLHFASPVTFKSQSMNIPIPLPNLVFGSLVDRWNAFSPVAISPEMRRFGEALVAISRYRLVSKAIAHSDGSLRIGGVGHVTYRSLSGDRYWLGVMQMLGDFAFYSGVGALTTVGFGQTRRAAIQARTANKE